jgi:hypothetical protein
MTLCGLPNNVLDQAASPRSLACRGAIRAGAHQSRCTEFACGALRAAVELACEAT